MENNVRKKILLTGSNGSIGSNLTPHLVAQGHTVVPITSDLTDYEGLRKEIESHKDADWLVHLGAVVNTILCDTAGRHAAHVNVLGTVYVAELAKEFGMKYCYFSTTAIYKPGVEPILETSQKEPATWYGHTKYLGEQTSEFIFKDKKEDLLIIRPCFAFGGVDDHSIGSRLIKSAVMKEPLHSQLDPEKYKDYMHVSNLSDALEKLLSADITGDYNISYGKPRKFGDIIKLVNEMGFKPRLFLRPELDYMGNHIVDNTKLKSVIDWNPTITLEEGLQEVAKRYENYGKNI